MLFESLLSELFRAFLSHGPTGVKTELRELYVEGSRWLQTLCSGLPVLPFGFVSADSVEDNATRSCLPVLNNRFSDNTVESLMGPPALNFLLALWINLLTGKLIAYLRWRRTKTGRLGRTLYKKYPSPLSHLFSIWTLDFPSLRHPLLFKTITIMWIILKVLCAVYFLFCLLVIYSLWF